jgi:hypothetical protein
MKSLREVNENIGEEAGMPPIDLSQPLKREERR